MSFHGHPTNNNQDAIPDTAASYVSDTTSSFYSGVSNLTDNSNSRASRNSRNSHHTSRSDSSSLRRDREREGRCADCGAQTHEIRLDPQTGSHQKVPLNLEGEVHRGRCLLCNPLPGRMQQQLPHQQQQQQMFGYSDMSLTLEHIDDCESVHSGASSVTQQNNQHQHWRATPPGSVSSGSRSVDGEAYRHRQRHELQHPRQRGGGRSDGSVASAQSYNSAPVQSHSFHSAPVYGGGSSSQSQHSNVNTHPFSVPSNASNNMTRPPLEEFSISRGRGVQSSCRHASPREQQRPHHRQQGDTASMNDNMAIDEDEMESSRESARSQQQQQQQQPIEEANIHQILSSMQRYPNHVPTQSKSLHSLWVLSWDNNNSSTIGRLGGLPLILNSMRLHPHAMTLQSNGLSTLENLAMDSTNRQIIADSDGIPLIVDVMAQFIEDKSIQQSGCTALANLADGSSAEQKSYVAERGGILAMMRAVEVHRGDESILRAAYQALRKLGYNPGS